MDQAIDLEHGLRGVLLSIAGLIAANLIVITTRGVMAYLRRNKNPTREQFVQITKALEANTLALDQQKGLTIKMSMDMRRIYLFLKVIAGSKWPAYRKKVEEIEKENQLNS